MYVLSSENIERVNWVVRLEKYTTFEFVIAGTLYIDEADMETDLFRIFVWANGNIEVMVANDEDYDIHEEVSDSFDLDDLVAYFQSLVDVFDNTDDYIKHYEECSEDEDIDMSERVPASDNNGEELEEIITMSTVSNLIPSVLKKIQYEKMDFIHTDGVRYDFDRYNVEMRSPMATHEYSVTVSHSHKRLGGDVVRYGSWDDLMMEEIIEILELVEKEGKLERPFREYIPVEEVSV